MKRLFVGAAVLAAFASIAPSVQAQTTSAITYGASAGLTQPIGAVGDVQGTGVNVQGHATYAPDRLLFALRGDLGLFTTPGKTISRLPGAPKTDGVTWITLNGNAVYTFSGAKDASFVPYVIGGAGLYNGSQGYGTNFGINAGGGVNFKVASINAFAEARVHNVFGNGGSSRLIPLSLGVQFKQ